VTFKNREAAGRRLVERLIQYRRDPTAIILALPRGGVAVGYQLSLGLHLPLDVFITRKLGAPDNPEYALGAVGETGTIYLNPDAMAAYGLSRSDLAEVVQVQQREIARRQDLYRRADRCRDLPTALSFSWMMGSPPAPHFLPQPSPSSN
jgi:putative phosphoribosyl transferase